MPKVGEGHSIYLVLHIYMLLSDDWWKKKRIGKGRRSIDT